MSAAPSHAATTAELGGGFIYVRRSDGQAAILVPHLQSAGVNGIMTPKAVNARNDAELGRWLGAWGLAPSLPWARVNQVHGATIVKSAAASEAADADGMWTDTDTCILIVKAADCAPVWLADVASKRFALFHAGWRGVAAGIVTKAVGALRAQGTRISDLTVAIGPHLRPCCFEVGPEVAEQFEHFTGAVQPAAVLSAPRQRSDSVALDLAAAIGDDLHRQGVRDEQTFVATACTRCNEDLFHSYRRNGSGGPLMAAVAAGRS